MELRLYLEILLRRWPLVVIPPVVALLLALVLYRSPAISYTVTANYIVGQEPVAATQTVEEERFFNWVVSQYIVNSITDWVNSRDFANRVSAELALAGHTIDADVLHQQLSAETVRSRLTLVINDSDEARLQALAAAATNVLTNDNGAVLPPLQGQPAQLTVIDAPVVEPVPPGLLDRLDIPIRVALGAAAGIGLALLTNYLDPTIHNRHELAALNLPLVAEIPEARPGRLNRLLARAWVPRT